MPSVDLSFIRKPVGIIMCFQIIFLLITFGLALGALPTESLKLIIDEDPLGDIWTLGLKNTLFVTVSGVLFGGSILLLVLGFFGYYKASRKDRIGNGIGSIFLGIMLAVLASFLIEEYVQTRNLLKDDALCMGLSGFNASSRKLQSRSAVEELANWTIDCTLDSDNICLCMIDHLLKFNVTIAAGALGLVTSLLYFIGGVLFFFHKK